MYQDLTLDHFRGVEHLELEDFHNINLIVGKNNSGKTTVLEALFLLSAPGNPELTPRTNSFRGLNVIGDIVWKSFFFRQDTTKPIRISSRQKEPSGRRTLRIFPSSARKYRTRPRAASTGEGQDPETNLLQIEGLRLEYTWSAVSRAKPTVSTARVIIKGKELEFEPAEDSSASTIRGVFVSTAVIGPGTLERLNSVQLKKRIGDVLSVLRTVDPSIQSVVIGTNEIIYCDVGLPELLPVNLLGDGLVRLLAVISAIVDMEGGVVFLDEVETGLHYSIFPALWSGIFDAATRFNVQVFASTHSLECVRAFSAEALKRPSAEDEDVRLYRVERQDGMLRPVSYNSAVLATSLEEDWEIR